MQIKSDFLVIGGGIAGLSYAIKVAQNMPESKVTVISKESFNNSNTQYAQGGIAGVMSFDGINIEKHIEDTMVAGDFQNKREVVELVVEKASESIEDLIFWGVDFDKDKKGNFKYGLEGGHSEKRILHRKDFTGKEIQEKLLKQSKLLDNLELLENHFALELIQSKKSKRVVGAYVFDGKKNVLKTFISKIVFIATGGVGQVYRTTTNPNVATGDGIALAHRIGVDIDGMELVQFHPTALFEDDQERAFLISEAVRGAGAILRNENKEAFMSKYDKRAELAPRDIVARANLKEIQNSTIPYVFLDVSHLDINKFKNDFPVISQKCQDLGLDLNKDLIPVVPAAHYLCGGIKVDEHAKSSIEGLYACGECSMTGLHGSNRLASNSLLEAVVFARQAYLESVTECKSFDFDTDVDNFWHPVVHKNISIDLPIKELEKRLKWLMSTFMAVEKSNSFIEKIEIQMSEISNAFEDLIKGKSYTIKSLEFRNILIVSNLMIEGAKQRKSNSGVFFNSDLVR
jgi:L-aspartate oxidase